MSVPLKPALLALLLLIIAFVPTSCRQLEIRIGSKKFTESVILGELLSQQTRSLGVKAIHFQELGGTRLVFTAMVDGEIDAYPEYTGTIDLEVFAGQEVKSAEERADLLAQLGISISQPIGFNNTYAIGLRRERAAELGVKTISDLNRHPELKLGMTNEFMDRGDGWPALKAHYGLTHQDVRGLDHDIAYRQLQQGAIDAMDVYSTDAKIKKLDMVVLVDDRNFFPRYDAVILYRQDLQARGFAELAKAFESFPSAEKPGILDESKIVSMNHAVEFGGKTEAGVAEEFLRVELGLKTKAIETPSIWYSILLRTWEHLDLVRRSLIPAILFGIPLGVIAHRSKKLGPLILGGVGVIQTIPALALLVLVMPLVTAVGLSSLGLGSVTAVLALFLYSLLPIVAGAFAGLGSIDNQYVESAESIGMTSSQRLWAVELPLASWSILSGVRTAAVMNVGFATLGALIGAGGYGQPILTGIRLDSQKLILQGAIPAAVMALVVLALFHWARLLVVPKGLRLGSNYNAQKVN